MTMQQLSSSQASAEVPVNENFESLDHQAVYGKNHPTTTGLTWGYYGGRWGGFEITAGTFTLAASDDTYIVVEKATGVISADILDTDWLDTTNYARVYLVTTSASAVTGVEDHRGGPGGVHGGGSVGAGAGTVTHTAGALTASAVIVGNGSADLKVLASLGTTTTVLHGNAAGLPTFGAVDLANDVTGVLPATAGGTGMSVDRRTVTAIVSVSGVLNIDYALGDLFTCALFENVTSITFSNLPGAGKGVTLMVLFTQDSTPRTVAFPASFKWEGGTVGVVSTGSGIKDLLATTTFDNGTAWQATLSNDRA
jgi:hypothetical protein